MYRQVHLPRILLCIREKFAFTEKKKQEREVSLIYFMIIFEKFNLSYLSRSVKFLKMKKKTWFSRNISKFIEHKL